MQVYYRKSRKERTCNSPKCQCQTINPKDKYVSVVKKDGFDWVDLDFHLGCYLEWVVGGFLLDTSIAKPNRIKKRTGRPRIFNPSDMQLIKNEWVKVPLTMEQKKRRAVLTANFHHYLKIGRDTKVIEQEMETIGGIPRSWSLRKQSSDSIIKELTKLAEVG